MRAWTVDADDIQVADDLTARELHLTPGIDAFLSPQRSDKFVVVATKGFGKTLLLKAKRVALQERAVCLPQDSLLDKPVGDKIFSSDMVALYGNVEPWSNVWLMAIAVATLKRLEMVDDLRVSGRLHAIVEDSSLRSVIDHFVNLLDLPRSELFKCVNDTNNRLVPRLRTIATPVAIFIDSVDEYFNKHIKMRSSRASDTGVVSPSIWYYSQMGLVQVAYELRRVSHHLKVFASVRKEAFAKFTGETSMVQQYRGSAIDLSYSKPSLREIFVNNIRREKERNLCLPGQLRADPIGAFVGRDRVTHSYTGEEEDVFDYIYRHTLRRPRDLMTIGQKLSDLPPEERRNEARLKVAVNQAATEIAEEYLNEISPYIGDIDLVRLFAMLPRHILSRDDVEAIREQYNAVTTAAGGSDGHVFGILYRAGLLGCIHQDLVSGTRVQRFLRPGDEALDRGSDLPASTYYLVHPVLAELVTEFSPEYARNIDPVNVVGDGRPWRERGETADGRERPLCVLKADIKQFSRFMESPDAGQAVGEMLHKSVAQHAVHCIWYEVSEGDAVTLAHDDANAIVNIALRMSEDLFEAPGNPQLRIALDHGPVRLDDGPEGRPLMVGGEPLRRAARIEPHVTAGEIWGTEEFRQALESRPTRYHASAVVPSSDSGGPAGTINVKKPGSNEPDIWVRLYRIEPRRSSDEATT
jgi:class 3 adenylate cyclase